MMVDTVFHPLQTRWIAIAGAPCSGKTTLVEALARSTGWPHLPDYARLTLRRYSADLGKPCADFSVAEGVRLQQDVACAYVSACERSAPHQPMISDYGLPCVYAWHRLREVVPSHRLIQACDCWRYDRVFLLEPLDLVNDVERTDDLARQQAAYREIDKAYRYFGYDPVIVPRFGADPQESLGRRIAFVLDHLAHDAANRAAQHKMTLAVV
jgi:predicted ATPase